MSEKDFSHAFCALVKPLDPVRVENLLTGATGLGIPDLNLSTGAWVELKIGKCWPKRGGPLRLPHFTSEQKRWALRRAAAGGDVFLALKVRSEWFIFDADGMQEVGNLTKEELIEASRHYFPVKPTSEQLCACFTT